MNPKRLFILMAAWFALVSTAGAENESLASIFTNATSRPAAIPRTSLIFIACHGLACGDLSCYGQTNFQTPNIDRLAAEGMRFTDFHVAGDSLAEAQAALMGGNNSPLAPGQATVAARLHQAGYFTGTFGEWSLGAQPWTQGWDDFGGFLSEPEAKNYYADGFWRYFHGTLQRETILENAGGKRAVYLPDMFMNAAATFACVHVPDESNRHRPFFMLLTLPAPESVSPGKEDYDVPTDAPFSGEPWPQAARNRAALLTRLDTDVGRLLEQLEKCGLTNNVAIFFTGAAAPEKFADTNLNFLQIKGEVRGGDSKERLRVPMIVRWPGHVPAGRVSGAHWSSADFAPTMLQIGKAQPEGSFKGVSILPVLLGQPGAIVPDTMY